MQGIPKACEANPALSQANQLGNTVASHQSPELSSSQLWMPSSLCIALCRQPSNGLTGTPYCNNVARGSADKSAGPLGGCWACCTKNNDALNSSLDLYNSSLALYTSSLDLYNSSLDGCSSSLDLYISSLELYTSSLVLYSSNLDLYNSSLGLYNSSLAI